MKVFSDAVDSMFARYDAGHSPGAAVAILKDGRVIYSKGYGLAQLEYDVKITPDTVFHIASISKQVTCFAICLLARSGKLTYDDEVRQHLPYVPDFGDTITIRHLMHHVSGMRDQWELLRLAGWRMDDVITQAHVNKLVARQASLNFTPGSEFLYCNTGYTLLAEIVSKVSGMTFRQFCEENIFRPLKMSSTHFHDDHEELVPARAYSYAPTEAGFRKSVLSYATVGATSLFTSVHDLAKWVLNFDTRMLDGNGALDDLFTQFTLANGETIPYMFGLTRGNYRGLCHVGHTGSDAGFRTACIRFPEQSFAVIIFANLSTALPAALAMEIADIYLQGEFSEPAEKRAQPTDYTGGENLAPYVGKYLISNIGVLIETEIEWDQLFITIGEQPRSLLLPCGEGQFYLELLRTVVTGLKDDTNSVIGLGVTLYGQPLKANRLDPLPLDDSQLQAFSGHYYSVELDTTYNLSPCKGGLTMSHHRHEDVCLVPTDIDVFEGTKRIGMVKFSRNDGLVIGFTLTGSRVRDIVFQKE